MGAGRGVAGGIGVAGGGGSAHAATASTTRLAVRKVAIRKFILDSIVFSHPHVVSEMSQSLLLSPEQ